jgi:hypothetical protein
MVSIYRPNSNINAFLMLFIFHCRIVHILLFVKSLKKKDKIFFYSTAMMTLRSAFLLKCLIQLKVSIFSKWSLAFIYFITRKQVLFLFSERYNFEIIY